MLINLPKVNQVERGSAGMEIQVWLSKLFPLYQELGGND